MSELTEELYGFVNHCMHTGQEQVADMVNRAADRIEELERQARWIPVSNKPARGIPVLLHYKTLGDGNSWQYVGRWTGEDWYVMGKSSKPSSCAQKAFTHWMQLPSAPEPPKEQHGISPELDKAAADLMSLSIRGRQ